MMMQQRFANFSKQCRSCRKVAMRTAAMDRPTVHKNRYIVSEAEKAAFKRDGFVHLRGVVTEDEMASVVDPTYFKFLRGEIPVPGKDMSDASVDPEARGHSPNDFKVVNVMLPRMYAPEWQGNLVEQRCEDIAQQLLETEDVELDFDQILAKRPRTKESILPWHQDAAYWPADLHCEASTANVWVAVSDVPMESGCLRYVPGSHMEESLRPHTQVGDEGSVLSLNARVGGERAVLVPMQRGDVVVHSERVLHSSGPNMSANWRCGYVLNFKRSTCIVDERAMGVTHSLNESRPDTWAARAASMKN